MTSETTTNAVTLKDYIIDMSSAAAKDSATYKVVLENNTDFIIKRSTIKAERELVVLVSKGLYYIRDCKTGSVVSLTESGLSSFLRNLKDNSIPLRQVYWLPIIFRESVEFIMKVVSDEHLTDMCRHNVLVNMQDPMWVVPFWRQNSRLFTRIYNMFPNMAEKRKYQACVPLIFWIEKQYGANEAMYFAEKLVQSGITELNFSAHRYYRHENDYLMLDIEMFVKIMESPYRINLRRFIDYILFDLYAQGYSVVDCSFFNEYLDYLQMQSDFYGKIKEKYPSHFKTEHDIMALKVNQAKLVIKCENFAQQNEAIKDLSYSGKSYCIVIPAKPEDLADEGINLSHCVGQYIDRVASGDCHILFMRRRSEPERSLITLQLCGRQICQAQGMNRRPITDQERKFLMQWGREKNIRIAV